MKKEELIAYKEEIEEAFGECDVLTSSFNQQVKNAGNTGKRKAHNGHSWIDYWRAMTDNHKHRLTCNSCGKSIFVGKPDLIDYVDFGDKLEEHKAHGGHLWINAPKGADYTGGRYITPLCPSCNGQHDKQININKGAVCCKELGAEMK